MKYMKKIVVILLLLVGAIAYAETFYPKSATIRDSQGTFTSHSFDSPAMNVTDYKSSVLINWGGNQAILNQNRVSPHTYEISQNIQGIQLIITAYRSSQSSKIYLVTVQQKTNTGSVTINFKP